MSSLFAAAGQAVVITFLVLFLLLLRHKTRTAIIEVVGPDPERRPLTSRIIDDIEGQIQQFLLVLVMTGTAVAVATWAALLWIGAQHAAVWGILAGVFNSIPYFDRSSCPAACLSPASFREASWPKRCYCRASRSRLRASRS